jgi:hypothetical protein
MQSRAYADVMHAELTQQMYEQTLYPTLLAMPTSVVERALDELVEVVLDIHRCGQSEGTFVDVNWFTSTARRFDSASIHWTVTDMTGGARSRSAASNLAQQPFGRQVDLTHVTIMVYMQPPLSV